SSGGAIRYVGGGNLNVINSTLTQNSAASNGGGIGFSGFTGIAFVRNCTIVGNTAGGAGQGGGIGVNSGSTGSVTIESSVVSGNSASTSAVDLFSGGTITAKFSALGSTAGVTTLSADATTSGLVGQNFKLGPLTANGGPTLTMLPALDSPLISKGSNPTAANVDQRGAGYGRVRTAVDIGAVEATTNFIVVNDLSSGLGSLRQAVADSNAFTGTDTIEFDAAAFALTDTTITLTGGAMFISDSVDIRGPGATLATVSGAGTTRIFQAFSGAGRIVKLSGLTLADASVAGAGGAITCAANLVVQNCAFRNNTAGAGEGGAINIENSGSYSLTIDRCSFTGNVGQLGGTVNFTALAPLSVTNSTFSGNKSLSTGGGALRIFSGGSPHTLLVRNCTFSGNTAATVGGAIELSSVSGTLTVQNSTIVNNSAATNGGGVSAFSTSPLILLESNIVSGNAAGSAGPDVFNAGTVNAKTCLLGSSAGITTFNPDATTTTLLGQAPQLGPLADNGGPTATHALTALSPAVDAGSNPAAVLAYDQRGPGFDRTSGKGTDIGAYELQIVTVTSATFNAADVQRSRVDRLDVAFSRVVSLPPTPEAAFQLVRQSDGAIVSMKAAVTNSPTTSVAFSFTGGPIEFGSLADGRYTLQISSGLVGGGNALLDGNGDGTGGDSYLLIGNPTNKLFRLYGDVDGTGTVDAVDLLAFRLAFLTASPALDFDNSGQVGGADFLAFRLRYLVTV
ncbi:MAG: right-handed parallel beta-helix repeat-containing protein, partial [Gemmataceae bacterium]|nr:right-handed parallel beta-helix repeat-containing protein [Gemmataceae bacterium]